MHDDKKKRLASKGWKVGSTTDFLGLSADEEAYVELRLRLSDGLKNRRIERGITQVALARAVRSSQSRVAKMEAGDPSVTVDLLIRTLLALGTSTRELAGIISGSARRRAA